MRKIKKKKEELIAEKYREDMARKRKLEKQKKQNKIEY